MGTRRSEGSFGKSIDELRGTLTGQDSVPQELLGKKTDQSLRLVPQLKIQIEKSSAGKGCSNHAILRRISEKKPSRNHLGDLVTEAKLNGGNTRLFTFSFEQIQNSSNT